ncbi:MAG: alkaline phosphatase D family protein [Planctomycetota bacterium]
MKAFVNLSVGALLVGSASASAPRATPETEASLDKIVSESVDRFAFGSCIRQSLPQHVWDSINDYDPDVFVWLGDNIYADSPRPRGGSDEANARIVLDRMKPLYDAQDVIPAYRELKRNALVCGTLDDHDFGINDAGVEFVGKQESQGHFYDFFDEPSVSEARDTEGVYGSYTFGESGRRVQLIILDTRYFRSSLVRGENDRSGWVNGYPGSYLPNNDPEATILGDAQWAWLEARLEELADLRLIATSIQFVANDHRFEKWGNIPHERRRLCKLISDTGANGVVFLSGDRHSAEISALDPTRAESGAFADVGYPLYDITASALTNSSPTTFEEQQASRRPRPVVFGHEVNRHRIGSQIRYNNFGKLEVDWDAEGGPRVTMEIRTDRGATLRRNIVTLDELRPD